MWYACCTHGSQELNCCGARLVYRSFVGQLSHYSLGKGSQAFPTGPNKARYMPCRVALAPFAKALMAYMLWPEARCHPRATGWLQTRIYAAHQPCAISMFEAASDDCDIQCSQGASQRSLATLVRPVNERRQAPTCQE